MRSRFQRKAGRMETANSISTGIYHFPVAEAAKIAVDTVKRFISANPGKLDIIKWILFDDHTFEIFENELRF